MRAAMIRAREFQPTRTRHRLRAATSRDGMSRRNLLRRESNSHRGHFPRDLPPWRICSTKTVNPDRCEEEDREAAGAAAVADAVDGDLAAGRVGAVSLIRRGRAEDSDRVAVLVPAAVVAG